MHGLKKIIVPLAFLVFLCFLSNILEIYIERKELKESIRGQIYNNKIKDIQSNNEQGETEIPDSLDQSALDYKFGHEKFANIN